MTDISYDPDADAVYITVSPGNVDRTEETGPFIYDVDADGHIVGIEILSASRILATGDWKKAGLQGAGEPSGSSADASRPGGHAQPGIFGCAAAPSGNDAAPS
jgi:uncharacterized protein YuzE